MGFCVSGCGLCSVLADVFVGGKGRVNCSQWSKGLRAPLVCISESSKFFSVVLDMTKGHLGSRKIVRALGVN